jgi:hypothetical protein
VFVPESSGDSIPTPRNAEPIPIAVDLFDETAQLRREIQGQIAKAKSNGSMIWISSIVI